MLPLFRKEIFSFLSSLTGYTAVAVYLLVNGLFLWAFSGQFNILDYGYAGLDMYFMMAPWVFLFLIPAITMRSFAEERKSGTIEMLFTKPITEWQIIFAKYLAALALVLFAILPTLIYYISVYRLGEVKGNLDAGGTWGSYIGLFFLGAGFVAIGLFASAVTNNSIVSFLLGVFLCGIFYIGFDFIRELPFTGQLGYFIEKLGINHHYSGMSRGVVDTRDVLYFASLVAFFLLLSRYVLQRSKQV